LISINGAIFPKVISNIRSEITKKIIRYETILGLIIIVCTVIFGKWIVLIMGGVSMSASYPIAIALSVTVLTWIVVGSYISFVFVPNARYYFVTKNQIIALVSFCVYCGIGLLFVQNILVLAIAISLSGLSEIVFCRYLIRKEKLF
jgi:PST family polysaccharide transporter